MMRRLLSDIVPLCVVRIFPVTREDLAEDRVQRFLDSAVMDQLVLWDWRVSVKRTVV